MTNALTTIDFHGAKLVAIAGDRPENTLVAMKPIVEGMGLDWSYQFRKLNNHPVLKQGIAVTAIPSEGGEQDGTCLSLDLLNFWLATIHPDRLKDEVRTTVIRYQTECARVLFNHFFGKAFHSAPKQSRNAQLRSAVALLGTSIKFNTRMGMDLQQARMKALVQVEDETGVDLAKTFGWTAQIAPQQVETLTPTQIGHRLGIGPREANQLLKQAGLQVDSRDAKNRISWAPTDNGLPYARLEDLSKAHTDGTTQAWRWYPKVVDFLRPFSRPKEAAS